MHTHKWCKIQNSQIQKNQCNWKKLETINVVTTTNRKKSLQSTKQMQMNNDNTNKQNAETTGWTRKWKSSKWKNQEQTCSTKQKYTTLLWMLLSGVENIIYVNVLPFHSIVKKNMNCNTPFLLSSEALNHDIPSLRAWPPYDFQSVTLYDLLVDSP